MSDNYYWINIDPKQSCSLAEDVSLKILKKTTYTCSYANGLFNNVGLELVPNNNICPSKIVASEGKEQITSRVNSVTYTIPTPVVEDKKRFYNDRNYSWKEYTIERRFMINNDITPDGLPTQDILVVARETYDLAIPPNENFNDGSADINDVANSDCSPPCRCGGNTNGKGLVAMFGPAASRIGKSTRVYNIFNLDNINTLKVQFRKVPRQIRGIDYNTTVHKYSSDGGTFRPLISVDTPTEISSGETLNNNFYCWECLQASQGKMVIQSSIPDFLKLQNEMIYRAFFGSVDGIENKGDLTSQYPWEMIPYEYDT
jgi:hypothetical protein